MRLLHVVVNNKIATYTARDGHIVCGNSGYFLKFTFDSEWDEYTTKTARFVYHGKYYDVDFTGDECVVPIVSGVDSIEVGVYAGSLTTTTPAVIPCERSILCLTSEVQTEQVPVYKDQIDLSLSQAMASAAESIAAAEESKKAAEESKKAAEEAANIADGLNVDAYAKSETYNRAEIDARFATIDVKIANAITTTLNTEV